METWWLVFKECVRICSFLLSLILNCILGIDILFLLIWVSCNLMLRRPRSYRLAGSWPYLFLNFDFISENLCMGHCCWVSVGLMCLIWINKIISDLNGSIFCSGVNIDKSITILNQKIIICVKKTRIVLSCAFFRDIHESSRLVSIIGVEYCIIDEWSMFVYWFIHFTL